MTIKLKYIIKSYRQSYMGTLYKEMITYSFASHGSGVVVGESKEGGQEKVSG